MYRPITMYQIVCDRCGEVFGGTDTCSALFSNKEVDIGDYSDWEMIDGKHYCPDCYEVEVIDGVYNVKEKIVMARKYEVNIRVTIDSKCKDSDDDIIEELMYGADKYFYPYCCNNEHIKHTNSTAHKIK